MKYSNPSNTSKSILHQFSKDKNIQRYIGGKKWDDVSMSFREMKTNSDKRKFEFVIRYGNPEINEWKLNQFDMNEDEIKQFLDIVYETVYNPPKFKEDYCIGNKFILPKVTVIKAQTDNYQKEIIYTNVKAEIIDIQNLDVTYYMLKFDDSTMIVKREYLDKLEKI